MYNIREGNRAILTKIKMPVRKFEEYPYAYWIQLGGSRKCLCENEPYIRSVNLKKRKGLIYPLWVSVGLARIFDIK